MMASLKINSLEEGCLICLNYFGIFRFPLNLHEVHHFIPCKADLESVNNTLKDLCEKKLVYQKESYFLIQDNPEWIEERISGKERALKLLSRSNKYSRIIASFPFVRGVAISGSLSKIYASVSPDIDYFIITEAHRLWISRTLLHMFKKLTFITGHQHYFCMNYFIDTHALSIEHPNLFSAIEIKTLLPVFNRNIFSRFESENNWTNKLLPNHPGIEKYDYLISNRNKILKRSLEGLINIFFPVAFNRFLMNTTDRKWRHKWRNAGYNSEEYNRAFRTDIHISKNHPDDYEKKVLELLSGKLKME